VASYNPAMEDILQRVFLGNSVQAWLTAVAAFLLTFTLLPLLRSFVLSRRDQLPGAKTAFGVELALALLGRTSRVFLWIVALYVGGRFLDSPPRVERFADIVIVVVTWMQVALWASTAVRFALDRQNARAMAQGDAALGGSLGVIMFVARLAIVIVAALLALDNLGVNITALVAGLGIGGIAIALAVQTVLGDLFASLSITLDRPFVVGDMLRIDDVEGRVERIGVKSTRLRSVTGEQIVVSNADLLKSRVRNLGRMPERRVLFTLSVAYDLPRDRIDRIPELVREIVAAQPDTRFEYCMLKALGDAAVQFEVCYFVSMTPPGRLLETQDTVNRRILDTFIREGVRFANAPRAVLLQAPGG
jgi:small-conductance mechanosensitive channel